MSEVATRLEQALNSNNIDRIKVALQEYADAVQQVKMQIMARELLAKLLNGELDETLSKQLRRLVQTQSTRCVEEEVLAELERYCAEVRKDPSSVLISVDAHVQRLKAL